MKYEQLSINDNLNCPEGGDAIDDCADCVYGAEYHCVNGECVRRTEDPSDSFLEPPKEVHR
jgi:hypothetical protein